MSSSQCSVPRVLRIPRTLIATIKDFGTHPCPRCLVSIDQIPAIGRDDDRKRRDKTRRQDNAERQNNVNDARRILYEEGYAITGDRVDGLLKEGSWVPTMVFVTMLAVFSGVLMLPVQNAFSVTLSPFGFDFHRMLPVNLLHEVELGVWKALLAHLIRMLHTCGVRQVQEFDERYGSPSIYTRPSTHIKQVSEWFRHSVTQFATLMGMFLG
jgi:hypothetical protein